MLSAQTSLLHMTTEIILLSQIAVAGIRELGVNCMLCCNTCVENNEREGVIRCRAQSISKNSNKGEKVQKLQFSIKNSNQQ